jgi:hypothetical protein
MSSRRSRSPQLGDSNPSAAKRRHADESTTSPAKQLNTSLSAVSSASTALAAARGVDNDDDITCVSTAGPGPGSGPRAGPGQGSVAATWGKSSPSWCKCGECEEEVKQDVSNKPIRQLTSTAAKPQLPLLCCMSVVTNPAERDEHGLVCKSRTYTAVINGGLTVAQFNRWKKRLRHNDPQPTSFDECPPKAKRLVVYAELYSRLEEREGWTRILSLHDQKQKPMPACILAAVRRKWPDVKNE